MARVDFARAWVRQATLTWINAFRGPRDVWAVWVAYAVLVVGVAIWGISSGSFFGDDPAEYLLSARSFLAGSSNLFTYPYPLLPIFYIPWVALVTNPVLLFQLADVFSAVLLVIVSLVTYPLASAAGASPRASLTAALMVGTAPIMLDGVGWGDQSQLLAMVFGTVALTSVLKWSPTGRTKAPIWAGVLLGLSVLSEPYSAAYFILATATFLILRERRNLFNFREILSLLPLALPVAIAGGALIVLQGQVASNALNSTLVGQLGNGTIWVELLVRITFGNTLLIVAYAILVLLVALVDMSPHPLGATVRCLVPALGVAVAAEALVLTPTAFADRFLYFIPLPMGLLSAALLTFPPLSPSDLRPARAGPSTTVRTAGGPTAAIPLLVVFVLIVQIALASVTYPGSINFYGAPNQEISGLTFLRGETGSILYVDPNVDMFPAAYASGQDVYPTVQPYWFTQNDQRSAAIDALTLAAGPQWLDAGSTRVVDSEPTTGVGSPSILSTEGAELLDVLSLNDSSSVATGPAGLQGSGDSPSLRQAQLMTETQIENSLLDEYSWPGVWVNKTTTVADNEVNVGFSLASSSGPWKALNLSFDSPDCTIVSISNTTAGSTSMSVTLEEVYQAPWTETNVQSTLSLTVTNGTMVGIKPAISAGGLDSVDADVAADPGHAKLQVEVRIEPPSSVAQPATTVLEPSVLASDGIRWVVLHLPAASSEEGRFRNDSAFTVYALSPYYEIFTFEQFGQSSQPLHQAVVVSSPNVPCSRASV